MLECYITVCNGFPKILTPLRSSKKLSAIEASTIFKTVKKWFIVVVQF